MTAAAIAQARAALFEKLLKSRESLTLAVQVFPVTSCNVIFWRGECQRLSDALADFGGAP